MRYLKSDLKVQAVIVMRIPIKKIKNWTKNKEVEFFGCGPILTPNNLKTVKNT